MKSLEPKDIVQLYSDSESADQDIFAEMRSNLLLVAGEHYYKRGSKFNQRIKDDKTLPNEQKVRLTKNHTKRIRDRIVNSITTYSPGVAVEPKNPTDLKDIKTAQLNQSVWEDLKTRNKIKFRKNEWCGAFIDTGEVAVKAFWNPFKGELLGYKDGDIDEDTGEAEQIPVYSGQIEYEDIFAANLLRHKDAKTMDDSPFLAIRKMVDIKELKSKVRSGGDDPELSDIIKKITASADETFVVLDIAKNGYRTAKDQVMLLEYYFKPCVEYPDGYFWIGTKEVKLWDGELPGGLFPIIYEGYDFIQTTPRGRSPIKQLRPYQVEVNRAASSLAEAQICLGDDKLIVQGGAKVQPGNAMPGVRSIHVSGMPPTILPGRSGDQYLPYMQSQIAEMYQVAGLEEHEMEKSGQFDPIALLFRSLKEKKQFSLRSDRFENFLANLCDLSLELARFYYDDKQKICAIGRNEFINISEFKTAEKLSYMIKLEPQTEDLSSRLGRHLTLSHALQYVGNQLKPQQIGKILNNMPFCDDKEMFDDLTRPEEMGDNMILALDRGEMPQPSKYLDGPYTLQKLTARTMKGDFKMLSPMVQQNYDTMIQQLEQIEAQKQQQIKMSESEFIPSGGYLVACDFYMPDPSNPEKLPKRIRVPSEALQWLLDKLTSQGSSQDQLSQMNTGAISEIAGKLMQMQPQGVPQGMPGQRTVPGNPVPRPALPGQISPGGMNGR